MRHTGHGAHGYNLGHMGNGKWGIMVNTADRDGAPWGMGHMGDGAHGQWGTWAMGHMDITKDTWAMANMVKGVAW